jgi:hypothetical protein
VGARRHHRPQSQPPARTRRHLQRTGRHPRSTAWTISENLGPPTSWWAPFSFPALRSAPGAPRDDLG